MPEVDIDGLCKEGRQFFRQGKYPLAIQAFEKALKANPDLPDVHDAVATAYFATKNYDKAVEHFTRVTQLKPMDAKPLINLGAVYNRKEEFQKAADILKKAITRDGKAIEAYYNMGIAYRGLGQVAMAINSYKEALRINPRMLDAIQNLANCLLEQGNHKAAVEQYKKALELNPDFERAQRGLKRAEEAQQSAAAKFSPFGRLVNEAALKQTPSQESAQIRYRNLSGEQKTNDRQVLRRLMIEMNTAADELHSHLLNELEDSIVQLNRAVQSGQRDTGKQLFSSYETFQEAFREFTTLQNTVQKLEKQLQLHESSMKES